MRFIDRENELKSLGEKWHEKKPHFIILYGRRRVGKTELIKQFIKGKKAIYFLADQRNEIEQLKELGRIVGESHDDTVLATHGFDNWSEVFKYFREKTTDQFVFAVDEYPYLVASNKAVGSIFQKGWESELRHSNIFLILCGSSVSVMEQETLDYSSALYGRRTGQIHLQPLSFKESREFFSGYTFEDFLGVFTVCDGIPQYLIQFDPKKSLLDNIKNKIFKKTEFLYGEVEFILKEELKEPKNYLSILKAISFGKTKLSEISNDTGLDRNFLSKYLKTLENLKIVKREVPVTEDKPLKSRRGIYLISDNFIRFWFQYVFPFKSVLELERFDEVLDRLGKNFTLLEAVAYEEVCRQMIWDFREKLFPFQRVGKWWDKNNEIDVVAINEPSKEILFAEAKWSNKKVGLNVYEDLKGKAKTVDWHSGKRKENFALFSKAGFTEDMIEAARKEKVLLIHCDKIIR